MMSDEECMILGASISAETARNMATYQSFGKYLTDACNEHPEAVFMVRIFCIFCLYSS